MSETASVVSSQKTGSSSRSRSELHSLHFGATMYPFLLSLQSTYHSFFSYLGLAVQLCQLLGFVLNPHFSHGESLQLLSHVLYASHLPFWDPKFVVSVTWNQYIAFFVVTAVTVVAIISTLAIVSVFKVRVQLEGSLMAVLRMALHSLTTVLFIPVLHCCFSQMVCNADGYLWSFPSQKCFSSSTTLPVFVVAIIIFMAISLMTYLTECTLFTEDYFSLHPLTRKHFVNDVLFATWRILSCLFFHVFLSESTRLGGAMLPVYVCGSSALMALTYAFFLPFVHQRTNRLYVMGFIAVAWLGFLVFISADPGSAHAAGDPFLLSPLGSMDVDGLLFLGLSIFIAMIGWKVADWRLNPEMLRSVAHLLDAAAPCPTKLSCMFPGGLPEYDAAYSTLNDLCNEVVDGASLNNRTPVSMETPFLTHVYTFVDVEASTRFLALLQHVTNYVPTPQMFLLASRIYVKGLLRFPENGCVVVCFASMISEFTTKPSLALAQCERTNTFACSFPTRYRAFRLMRHLKQELHLPDPAYQRICEEAKRSHKEVLVNLYQFWMKLNTQQDRKQLLATYSTIAHRCEKTNEAFMEALEHQASGPDLVFKYADFLEQVMFRDDVAAQLRVLAKQDRDGRWQSGVRGRRSGPHGACIRVLRDRTHFDDVTLLAGGVRLHRYNIFKIVLIMLLFLVTILFAVVVTTTFQRQRIALQAVQHSATTRTLRMHGDLLFLQYWVGNGSSALSFESAAHRINMINAMAMDMLTMHNFLLFGLPRSITGRREKFFQQGKLIGATHATSSVPVLDVTSFLGVGYDYAQRLEDMASIILRNSSAPENAAVMQQLTAAMGLVVDSYAREWAVNAYNSSVQACKQWYVEETLMSLVLFSVLFCLGVVVIVLYAEVASFLRQDAQLKNNIISLFSFIPHKKLQEIATQAKQRVELFGEYDRPDEQNNVLLHEAMGGTAAPELPTSDTTTVDTEKKHSQFIKAQGGASKPEEPTLTDGDDDASDMYENKDEDDAFLRNFRKRNTHDQKKLLNRGVGTESQETLSEEQPLTKSTSREDGDVKEIRKLEYIHIFIFLGLLVTVTVSAVLMAPMYLNNVSDSDNAMQRLDVYNTTVFDMLFIGSNVVNFVASPTADLFDETSVQIVRARKILPAALSYSPTETEVLALRDAGINFDTYLGVLNEALSTSAATVTYEIDSSSESLSSAQEDNTLDDVRQSLFGAKSGTFLPLLSDAYESLKSAKDESFKVGQVAADGSTLRNLSFIVCCLATAGCLVLIELVAIIYRRHGRPFFTSCFVGLLALTLGSLLMAAAFAVVAYTSARNVNALQQQRMLLFMELPDTLNSIMWPALLAGTAAHQGKKMSELLMKDYFIFIDTQTQWHSLADTMDSADATAFTDGVEKLLYLEKIALKLSAGSGGHTPVDLEAFTWNFDAESDAMDVRLQYPDSPLRYTTTEKDMALPPEDMILRARDVVSNERMRNRMLETVSRCTSFYERASRSLASEFRTKNAFIIAGVVGMIGSGIIGLVSAAIFTLYFFRLHSRLSNRRERKTRDRELSDATMPHEWTVLFVFLVLLTLVYGLSVFGVTSRLAAGDQVDLLKGRSFQLTSDLVNGELWIAGRHSLPQLRELLLRNWYAQDASRLQLATGRTTVLGLDTTLDNFLQGTDVRLTGKFELGFESLSPSEKNSSGLFVSGLEGALAMWMQQTVQFSEVTTDEEGLYQLSLLRGSARPLLYGVDAATEMLFNHIIRRATALLILVLTFAGVLAATIFLLSIFVLLPVARRQTNEEMGYHMLLRLIPADVRDSIPTISDYVSSNTNADHLHTDRDVVDKLMVPIIAINEEGTVILFNRNAEEVFEYSSAEVVGNNVSILMPDEVAISHDSFLEKYRLSRPTNKRLFLKRELHGRKKSGAIFPICLTVHQVCLRGGAGGFLAHLEDNSKTVALKREEELSQIIQLHAPVPMTVIDTLGTILRFNRAAEECFGYLAADVINQNVKVLMPDDIATFHDAYLATYLRTKQKHMLDQTTRTRGVRKNGKEFPVELKVKEVITDNVVTYIGFFRDVSDDIELELPSLINNSVLQSSLIPIICTDMYGKVLLFSASAERVFGYLASDVIDHNCRMLMPASVGDQHDDYLEQYRNSWTRRITPLSEREVVGRHKDGYLIPLRAVIHEVKTRIASQAVLIGFFMELTEDRSLEKSLDVEDAVVEHHRNPLVILSGDGTIQRVNKSALIEFGYHRDELLNRSVSALVPELEDAESTHVLRRYLDAGDGGPVDGGSRRLQAIRKNGTSFPIELRVREVRDSDDNAIFVVFMRNVTNDLRMERQTAINNIILDEDPSPLIVTDEAGRITYLNGAATRLLQYRSQDVLGKSIYEFVPETDALKNGDNLKDLYSHKSTTDVVSLPTRQRFRAADGVYIPVDVLVKEVISVKEHEPSFFITALRDARNDGGVELMTRRNEVVWDLCPTSLVEFDFNGKVVRLNLAAQLQLNWPVAEVAGQHVSVILSDPTVLQDLMGAPGSNIYDSLNLDKHAVDPLQATFTTEIKTREGRLFPAEVRICEVVAPRERKNGTFIATLDDLSETFHFRSLHERRNIFAELFPYSLVVINTSGVILSCNSATCQLFRYASPSKLIGRKVNMLMPDAVASAHDGYLLGYAKTHERGHFARTIPVECKRSDDTLFSGMLHLQAIAEEGRGDDTLLLGCVVDRSEDMGADHAERISVTLLQLAQDAFIVTNATDIIQSASASAAQLFGFDRVEMMVGKQAHSLISEPFAEDHDAQFPTTVGANRKPAVGRKRSVVATRLDGTTFEAELCVYGVTLGDERLHVGCVRNLTKENQLHSLRKLNQDTTEYCPLPLVSFNNAGIVHVFNSAAQTFLGYAASEMIGSSVSHLFPETGLDPSGGYVSFFRRSLTSGAEGQSVSYHMQLKNGDTIPVKLSVKIIPDTDGTDETCLLAVSDRCSDSAMERVLTLNDAVKHCLPMPYVTISASGLILECNLEAVKHFGYRSEELIGLSISALVRHELLEQRLMALSDPATATAVGRHPPSPYTVPNVPVHTKKGDLKAMNVHVSETNRVDPSTKRITQLRYLIFVDLDAEYQHWRTLQRFTALFEFTGTPAVLVQPGTLHVLGVNHAAERLLEWPAGDICGLALGTLITDEAVLDRIHHLAGKEEIIASKGVALPQPNNRGQDTLVKTVTRVRRRGGGVLAIGLTVQSAGERMVLLLRDLEEEGRHLLRASLYTKMLRTVSEAYFILNEQEEVVTMNQAAEQLLGYRAGVRVNMREVIEGGVVAWHDKVVQGAEDDTERTYAVDTTTGCPFNTDLVNGFTAQLDTPTSVRGPSSSSNHSEAVADERNFDHKSGLEPSVEGLRGSSRETAVCGEHLRTGVTAKVSERTGVCAKADGSFVHLELRVCEMSLAGGPDGVSGRFEDHSMGSSITRSGRSTEALSDSPASNLETRYFVVFATNFHEKREIERNVVIGELLIETNPRAIVVLDEEGTILKFNAAAERLFAFQRTQVIGRNVSTLIPDGIDDITARHSLAPTSDQGIPVNESRRSVIAERRDGHRFTVELTLRVVQDDLGSQIMVVGYIRVVVP